MKAVCLVTVTDPRFERNATLSLDTLRVGFPTWEIEIWFNSVGLIPESGAKRCDKLGATYRWFSGHHADWIRDRITGNVGTLFVVDPDIVFHKNVEGFTFDQLLAGHYVPCMWNEYAQCPSLDRLHTEFLVVKDCQRLLVEVKNKYQLDGCYSLCDPFMPKIVFYKGQPVCYDTCCNLFQMVGGRRFTESELSCYSHVNSSSFVKEMSERMENGEGFRKYHEAVADGSFDITGNWKLIDEYYERMSRKVSIKI